MKSELYIFLYIFLFVACGNTSNNNSSININSATDVPIPYYSYDRNIKNIAAHYWDNFDFADTTLISNAENTELAFVDFVNILPYAPNYREGIDSLFARSLRGSQEMFNHFVELSEKYLYDPNSPMRSEELFVPVIESIIANNALNDVYKVRPRHQLEMALKNQVGEVASNFTYTQSNGTTANMHNIKSDYTILFFNNPDCTDCKRVKEILSQMSAPSVKIVAMYIDDDIELWRKATYPKGWINGYSKEVSDKQLYDLRAIPTLYLLDNNKRVLLKDTFVEVIIKKLQSCSFKEIYQDESITTNT